MRTYIIKTKNGLQVFQETTTQSILSDLMTILVIVVAVVSVALFEIFVGPSLLFDMLAICMVVVYLSSSLGKKNKRRITTRQEFLKFITELETKDILKE